MTWAAAWALVRRFWWALPIVALAGALLVTRETLADRTAILAAERTAWTAEIDRAEKQRADQERSWATAQVAALDRYAAGLAARDPIIVRSTDTVREYAKTDAGRVLCRGADRVRAIDALDAELVAAPGTTGGGGGAVPSVVAAPPAGR